MALTAGNVLDEARGLHVCPVPHGLPPGTDPCKVCKRGGGSCAVPCAHDLFANFAAPDPLPCHFAPDLPAIAALDRPGALETALLDLATLSRAAGYYRRCGTCRHCAGRHGPQAHVDCTATGTVVYEKRGNCPHWGPRL